jgi:hypothetical protein
MTPDRVFRILGLQANNPDVLIQIRERASLEIAGRMFFKINLKKELF